MRIYINVVVYMCVCNFWLNGQNSPKSYFANVFGVPSGLYSLSCELGLNSYNVNLILDSRSSSVLLIGERHFEQIHEVVSLGYYKSDPKNHLISTYFKIKNLQEKQGIDTIKTSDMIPFNISVIITNESTYFQNKAINIDGTYGFFNNLNKNYKTNEDILNNLNTNKFFDAFDIANEVSLKLCGSTQRSSNQLENVTTSGGIFFGKQQSRVFFQFIETISDKIFAVVLTDISIDKNSLVSNCSELNSGLTIIDTLTSDIVLPRKYYAPLLEQIHKFQKKHKASFFLTYVCHQKNLSMTDDIPSIIYTKLPTIEFDFLTIKGQNPLILRLSLSPQQYMRYLGINQDNFECFQFAISESQTDNNIKLGLAFIEGFEIIFSQDTRQIGFRDSDCIFYNNDESVPLSRVIGKFKWDPKQSKLTTPDQCSPKFVKVVDNNNENLIFGLSSATSAIIVILVTIFLTKRYINKIITIESDSRNLKEISQSL